MPSLAFRKASICSRFSFSASCTLVVNPQHATRSRLILYWKLPPPSGSSCIGKDYILTNGEHYVFTWPTELFRIGPLRTTPRKPLSRRGPSVLTSLDYGRELLHGIC